MTRRLTALSLIVTLLGLVVFTPLTVLAQSSNNPFQDIPVTAPLPGGGAFVGTLDITLFQVRRGTLTALGTLTGTFHQPGGVTTPLPPTPVQIPVTDITASSTCQALFLTLGPIHLALKVGLIVDVNEIIIRITANPSQGITGQLLCDIAGDFDLGKLPHVAILLNQLLALFG
jgi:hypothetical protein